MASVNSEIPWIQEKQPGPRRPVMPKEVSRTASMSPTQISQAAMRPRALRRGELSGTEREGGERRARVDLHERRGGQEGCDLHRRGCM
ncbi:hypothetical protein [Paracraurococcus lichenis]|uniref:Uncharacterized protein n=1 Tax=Paracraurococcus lichenis TaxID=3064888 RepID=A0ABT9E3Z2_9PROT|nr:hypothetical protein [Paracraurococcus sp. LOR1-02]MDO9710715.1 hypothetical protein [Paracraurococcus sp. LOR1-02]